MPEEGSFLRPRPRVPWPLSLVLKMTEKKLGKPLKAIRILAWSPRLTLGTGIMEGLVVHHDRELPRRLLKLVRVAVSYAVSCPFCIDLNASGHGEDGVSDDEVQVLARLKSPVQHPGFSPAETAALEYALAITATPVRISRSLEEKLKSHFSDRALALLGATAAQVNLWARLIQAYGVSEAGFSSDLNLLQLEKFRTRIP